MSKENHCPICGHKEHFEAETSLYECSNRRCKLSGLWFSGAEWRRLCKKQPDQPEQPLEMVTLRDRFAMAALTGLFSAQTYAGTDKIAVAFEVADECMKQRTGKRT